MLKSGFMVKLTSAQFMCLIFHIQLIGNSIAWEEGDIPVKEFNSFSNGGVCIKEDTMDFIDQLIFRAVKSNSSQESQNILYLHASFINMNKCYKCDNLSTTLINIAVSTNNTKTTNLLLNYNANPYYRDSDKNTALHLAARNGNIPIVQAITGRSTRGIHYKNRKGESALLVSAKFNDSDLFREILVKGGNPYDPQKDNTTPLHLATQKGNEDIIKIILKVSSKGINIQNFNKSSALHIAAQRNFTKIFELLLDHGAKPYLRNIRGETCLHEAVKQKNSIIIEKIVLKDKTGIDIKSFESRTALQLAVSLGLKEISILLLKLGASPTEIDNDGMTALHIAAIVGLPEVVEHIVSNNVININQIDNFGYTAFHWAVVRNHTVIVEFFLETDAKPFIPEKRGTTPLHSAVNYGFKKIVQLILKKSSKGINAQERNGFTALYIAAVKDNFELFKLLLNNGANPNLKANNGMKPLHAAAKFGNVQILESIISKFKINIDEFNGAGFNALYIGSYHNRSQAVQLLLKYKANPLIKSKNRYLPLHIAAEFGYLKVVQVILESSIEIINSQNEKGSTALYIAIFYNKSDVAEYLLNKGADPDIPVIFGKTPLHAAALKGNKKIITELLKKTKRSINVQSIDGSTVLHMACEGNSSDIVQFLLSLGADPNIANYEEWLPIHLCAQFDHWQTAVQMLNKTKNINAQNIYGNTALMIAAFNGHILTTELILSQGADPFIYGSGGRNLVHTAAEQGMVKLLKILKIEKNASLDLQDTWGYTPLSWAINRNQENVIHYLLTNNVSVTFSDIFNHNVVHSLPRLRNSTTAADVLKQVTNTLKSAELVSFINQRDIYGFTPLSLAALAGNENVFLLLISNGADINNIDFRDHALLHHAALGGSVNISKYILDHSNQSKYTAAYNKITPIMFSALNKRTELLDFFIGNDTKIYGISTYGVTILHYAATSGNVLNIIRVLNKTQTNVSHINVADYVDGYTPLMVAVQGDNYNATKYLINAGGDPLKRNAYEEDSITLAARYASLEILKLFDKYEFNSDQLLGNALARNRKGTTDGVIHYFLWRSSIRKNLLFYAVASGNNGLLHAVLDNITISRQQNTWTHHLMRFPVMMEQFLKEYDDSVNDLLDEDDQTPLFNEFLTPLDVSLLFFGQLSTVNILIQRLKIDIVRECKRKKKLSPLDFAIFRGNPELFDFILHLCNETVSQNTNKYGWTAMHTAVWAGNENAFAILRKYKVSYSQPDLFNRTPLHIASIKGNRFMVRSLLRLANKTIDSRDIHGFTPLHLTIIYAQGRFFSRFSKSSSDLPATMRFIFASLGMDKDVYSYYASALALMKMNANLNIQDKAFGWTPLHWAAVTGEAWMAYMLVSRGAKLNIPSWDDETPMKLARKWGKKAVYNYLKSKGGVW